MKSSKISRLLLRRTLLVLLLNIVIMIVFTTRKQEDVLADENEHSFHLPSIFKHDNDLHSKEILFTAKYPGTINVNVSWEPCERKLTVTLYDQNGQSLISKKDESPLNLDYTYSQEHYEKAKFFGNTFRVGISPSLFKTLIGSVKISTPARKVVEGEDHEEVRGPFGTFIEEENPEK
jgi:hypothetical protein